MQWPFRHISDDGQFHLHWDNWHGFRRQKESEYPHNWLHRRLFMLVHSPADSIENIKIPDDDIGWLLTFPSVLRNTPDKTINHVSSDWSVIFEPFPAWFRTPDDPQATGPSFHLFLEDKHPKPTHGDPVVLHCTANSLTTNSGQIFAEFRGQFWVVERFQDMGTGVSEPRMEEIHQLGTKRRLYRSIDDE